MRLIHKQLIDSGRAFATGHVASGWNQHSVIIWSSAFSKDACFVQSWSVNQLVSRRSEE